ncbi:hypothetical protein SAMN05444515_10784 [Ectothiorhodospira marina]|uniref:Uncharacterized protein n=1 Tax=Ectothiorhodospira marina TaxID=1396821 RepID=A0A1H7LBR5_9GAMM|nr:hypothetical protein SAMN05444515_10784 [Ectothiorhodospira marina]
MRRQPIRTGRSRTAPAGIRPATMPKPKASDTGHTARVVRERPLHTLLSTGANAANETAHADTGANAANQTADAGTGANAASPIAHAGTRACAGNQSVRAVRERPLQGFVQPQCQNRKPVTPVTPPGSFANDPYIHSSAPGPTQPTKPPMQTPGPTQPTKPPMQALGPTRPTPSPMQAPGRAQATNPYGPFANDPCRDSSSHDAKTESQ